MTTFILRWLGRRGNAPLFWTIDPDRLHVQFKQRTRRTGRIGSFPVVAPAGVDRSTVSLRARFDSGAKDARGLSSTIGWLTFRLLDRNKHIRILMDEDVAEIAARDAVIAERLGELKALRNARRDYVQAAWDRGEKIDIALLEEKANA